MFSVGGCQASVMLAGGGAGSGAGSGAVGGLAVTGGDSAGGVGTSVGAVLDGAVYRPLSWIPQSHPRKPQGPPTMLRRSATDPNPSQACPCNSPKPGSNTGLAHERDTESVAGNESRAGFRSDYEMRHHPGNPAVVSSLEAFRPEALRPRLSTGLPLIDGAQYSRARARQ